MYRDSEDRSIIVVGLNGVIAGVDRRTGKEVWRNQLPGAGYGIVDLAITEHVVLATASARALFCLDYRTGQTLWTAPTHAMGRGTILVDRDLVMVSKQGYLDAYDLSGTHLWTQELTGMGTGRAALGTPGNVRQADDYGKE